MTRGGGDDEPRDGDGERDDAPGGAGPSEGAGSPGGSRDGTGEGGDEVGDEPGDEDGGGVWRFALDEVDEEGIVRPSIEPGDPDLENVLFVLLGAIAMVLIFVRLWMLV